MAIHRNYTHLPEEKLTVFIVSDKTSSDLVA
jgi:hypothetical protein